MLSELIDQLPGLLRENTISSEKDLQSVIHSKLPNSFKEVGVFITRTGNKGGGLCDFVLVEPHAYTIIEVKFVHQGCLIITKIKRHRCVG